MSEMSIFAKTIMEQKYSHILSDGTKETWENIAYRTTKNVLGSLGIGMNTAIAKEIFTLIKDKKFIPAGRYLYSSGRPFHQVQNCLALRAEDSREGWSELLQKASLALMTGAGIGVEYSLIRSEGKLIRRTGGTSTGPLALMQIVNDCGRGIMQGGNRRSAIFAGLSWQHPDVHKFIRIKNWEEDIKSAKAKDFSFPAPLDGTNISVGLDDEFFKAYNNDKHKLHAHAQSVYWATIEQMCKTGEPGFSINAKENNKTILRNACSEFTSEDDSDVCNLGSINMARISSKEEMDRVVELSTLFLIAGTVYSDVPYPKVDLVRTKNRRIGVGLMGLHEWLLVRNKPYGQDAELEEYLKIYQKSTDYAKNWAEEYELSIPTATRSIAPVGSIGIIAETTTGIEPIFCTAYKRRYLKHKTWNYQYVIDPTAKKLIENKGISPDQIEDAYVLAEDVERRVKFQVWVQKFVDMGISSTINLPSWGSETNNQNTMRTFGTMLINYLPDLRGITAYPDGARDGQPLVPIKYTTAIKYVGQDLTEEYTDVCDLTKGGSCGS